MVQAWIDAGYWPAPWLAREPADDAWRRRLRAERALRALGAAEGSASSRANGGDPLLAGSAAAQLREVARLAAAEGAGRIPVPRNAAILWAQHKYSMLARDPARYRALGPAVAAGTVAFSELADELAAALTVPPPHGRLRNALQHMWGHVTDRGAVDHTAQVEASLDDLLRETRRRAVASGERYLLQATALGELGAWIDAD